jgi:hypothetical protein
MSEAPSTHSPSGTPAIRPTAHWNSARCTVLLPMIGGDVSDPNSTIMHFLTSWYPGYVMGYDDHRHGDEYGDTDRHDVDVIEPATQRIIDDVYEDDYRLWRLVQNSTAYTTRQTISTARPRCRTEAAPCRRRRGRRRAAAEAASASCTSCSHEMAALPWRRRAAGAPPARRRSRFECRERPSHQVQTRSTKPHGTDLCPAACRWRRGRRDVEGRRKLNGASTHVGWVVQTDRFSGSDP